VVEALLDGKWRVLDPLFGYTYRTDQGALATAEDLQKDPELVARVAQADVDPFPVPYRIEAFDYRRVTRFNWFRFRTTLALRDYVGPRADRWAPPATWNSPFQLAAFVLLLSLVPVVWWSLRRRASRAP
jgi:hypothetical protein